MRVFQINTFGDKSTGHVAVGIYRTLREQGNDSFVAYGRNCIPSDVNGIKVGSRFSVYADGALTRITDRAGHYSYQATKNLLDRIREYDPDIIQLHNLHGYYVNVDLLFRFLREYGKPVVWTLHDCWAYTGHCCSYFSSKCEKWETGCFKCAQKRRYPKSILIDNSKNNFRNKEELFNSIPNLRLVCVSNWLEKEVGRSFLHNIPREVIYNGIDISEFYPSERNYWKKYFSDDRKIILGLAANWKMNKGIDDFVELSKMLSDEYRIVLVGVSDKQKKYLPKNITSISYVGSIETLRDMYSGADVYFNSSAEETLGMTMIEAMACGTPIIAYNTTAMPEVCSEKSGVLVGLQDIAGVREAVDKLIKNPPMKENVVSEAMRFESKLQFSKYIDLYGRILQKADKD